MFLSLNCFSPETPSSTSILYCSFLGLKHQKNISTGTRHFVILTDQQGSNCLAFNILDIQSHFLLKLGAVCVPSRSQSVILNLRVIH